jgi:hypothetical protein
VHHLIFEQMNPLPSCLPTASSPVNPPHSSETAHAAKPKTYPHALRCTPAPRDPAPAYTCTHCPCCAPPVFAQDSECARCTVYPSAHSAGCRPNTPSATRAYTPIPRLSVARPRSSKPATFPPGRSSQAEGPFGTELRPDPRVPHCRAERPEINPQASARTNGERVPRGAAERG